MTEVHEDVVCTFCGALCDDIVVTVENNKIVGTKKACRAGKSRIMGHDRIGSSLIRSEGELSPCDYETATTKAAEILDNADRPLLYGFCATICEAQKMGIALAEKAGAVIDSSTSVCHGPTVLAVQQAGMPSATLGEVKNRADLVIYWGCNPLEAHIRHTTRYSASPKGYFTPEGRRGRKIVAVDVDETKTAKLADTFVKVEPNSDYKVLSALRAILAGKDEILPEKIGGVPVSQLKDLVEEMKAAKYGMIFFGMGLTQSKLRYRNVENAIKLVTTMNNHTKFGLLPMRGHYNVAGFGQVCAWQTGFPFSVDFSRGFPYYNPGETSAVDLLSRGEVDAVVVVAADPGAHFPNAALKRMSDVPVVLINPHPSPTGYFADVIIPSAIGGIEVSGTAYRMDAVSLEVDKLVESEFLSDEEILKMIYDKVSG